MQAAVDEYFPYLPSFFGGSKSKNNEIFRKWKIKQRTNDEMRADFMEGVLESRFDESKKLLKELGYDGTPIVVLQTSDNPTLTNLAPVTKTLLERGGFKVDVQSMDWQTLVARRTKQDPVAQGGWNIAQTAAAAVLLLDPVNNHYAEASGDRAQFGWPLDEEIEKLRMT